MIGLGLSAADQRVFDQGLTRDHAVSATVRILDMDHHVLAEAGRVLSGQVDVDSTADVERSCSVEVLDPDNALGLLGTGPTDPRIVANRLVQVTYDVRVPQLSRWVSVPIFTGQITKAEATDGGGVQITGKGKESLLLEGASGGRGYSFSRGVRKTDIISSVLASEGEEHRRITLWNAKTTTDVCIAAKDGKWPTLKALARSLTASESNFPWLGYDGRGMCVLRSHSKAVKWTFGTSQLTGEPKVTFDTDRMRNLVVATGNDSGGGKKVPSGTARAPSSHAFSAQALARGGVPRWVREDISGDWASDKECQKAANEALADLLKAGIDVEFESLIVPHLEPRDVVRVVTDTWMWDLQVTKFTIPLAASQAMSHGRHTLVVPKIKYAMKGRTR